MAIFHLSAKVIGRSSGHSSVAAAAYRAGVKLVDERTGETHDYTRKQRVGRGEILAPANAPAFVLDRAQLWNAVERIEGRKDAQLAREIEFSLPMELSSAHQKRMAREFVQRQFVARGMVADVAFHNIGEHNPHCHVLLTMRRIEGDGFGQKERTWNAPALLIQWREAWAKHANLELARAKKEARIDHRSIQVQRAEAIERGDRLKAAALDRPAQIHVGHKQSAERREANAETKALALAKVAVATLREQQRAEGAANAAWQAMLDSKTIHTAKDKAVYRWKKAHPTLVRFFDFFGRAPAALVALRAERDAAAVIAREAKERTEQADREKRRARELAELHERQRLAAMPQPTPKPQEQAPASPAQGQGWGARREASAGGALPPRRTPSV